MTSSLLYPKLVRTFACRLYSSASNKVTCSRRFEEKDLFEFANLTGDHNPIHLDENFASNTGIFERRVVHGALINGFVSGILGTKLPGPGSVAFSQEIRFPKPLYLGEEMVAEVKVVATKRKFVECEILCRVPEKDKIVMSGKATVMLMQQTK